MMLIQVILLRVPRSSWILKSKTQVENPVSTNPTQVFSGGFSGGRVENFAQSFQMPWSEDDTNGIQPQDGVQS